MVAFVKSWIMTVITLAVFLTMMEILLPSGRTRKLVNMVSGFLIVITIINPVLERFGSGVDFEGISIEDGMFLEMKSIEQSSRILDETQTQQIVELYRRNIGERIRQLCEKREDIVFLGSEVQLVEDSASENFGRILRIYVDIAITKGGWHGIEPVKPVRRITIGGAPSEDSGNDPGSPVRKELEREIAAHFDVGVDDVVINVYENGSYDTPAERRE